MSADTTWWVSINGQAARPMNEADIEQKLTKGELCSESYASRAGTEDWKRLAEFPEFDGKRCEPSPDGVGECRGAETREQLPQTIEVICKHCKKTIQADSKQLGTIERCSHCDRLFQMKLYRHRGQTCEWTSEEPVGSQHGNCEGSRDGSVADNMADVLATHWDDVRVKAFWVAVVITLLLCPAPAVITKILGEPKAGMEEVITIWNVLWHTLPLTIAAAICAGCLWWFTEHPDDGPKTEKGWLICWCIFGVIIIVSMLIGSWLGKVEMSEWSKDRTEELQSVGQGLDRLDKHTNQIGSKALSRNAPKLLQKLSRNPKARWIVPVVVIVVTAFAALANYFTLYGPAMFLSSLIVAGFIGWGWAIKFPRILEDIAQVEKT